MLVEISIENLGVIERSRLTFGAGFTVLTGETGAGKTMLVEAINLVCGQRAEATVVRDGHSEAHVEARFIRTMDGVEEEIILARTILREGRSRAYINGRMATVAALAEMGAELIDIHGQHGHQGLLSAAAQRDSLDEFASVDLGEVHAAREELVDIDAMLAALGGDEKSRAREIDLLDFQCAEIESANIVSPDEDETLEAEEDLLADVVTHSESLMRVIEMLSGDGGAIEQIGRSVKDLASVGSVAQMHDRLSSVGNEIDDIVHSLREALEKLEEDPERLAEVRQRRQSLRDLRRKYGDSLADVIDFGREARARLDELNSYSERVADLQQRRSVALERLRAAQKVVGDQRRAAAPTLAGAIEARLRDLAMAHATVVVSVGDAASDPAGDSVVFMLAANPGSAPAPLAKVASGGELARVMLSLRLVLSKGPETMVFDEVDAGIGGAAAIAVATALRELGDSHQVMAVTHLAQVAASAHHHVSVTKKVEGGRTYAEPQPVRDGERVTEVARMLSGGIADVAAMAHATEMLRELGDADRATKATKKPRRPA